MQRARSSRRAATAAASFVGSSLRVTGFHVVAEYMLPVSFAGPAPATELIGKRVSAMFIAVLALIASHNFKYS
jgi:hypothetical protein